jgi:hypothetical protein
MRVLLKNDIITSDKYLEAFPTLYFKTDCVVKKSSTQWRGAIHNPPDKNQQTIISGHSDYGVTDELVKYYNPQTWWTINKQTTNSCVHALPLGITNNTKESTLHSIYGNVDCMIEVMNEPKNDKNLVYMNFNRNTYHERKTVYDIFSNKPWVTIGNIENTLEGRTKFLRQIRNHTFVLCPRGNGVDTHRLWETLYMGSIPIVRRDIGYSDFYDLPICFVDSWEQVTLDFLEKEKVRIQNTTWNLDKLKITYWLNRINASIGKRMKIGTVLTACDLNPLYCDFIPPFIKAWKTLFPEIDVVVVLVAEEVPDTLKEYSSYIRISKPIEGIHTAFHAQCIRLLYPRHIDNDKGVLITDMDMLPMNRSYYEKSVADLSDSMFIAYRDICLPHEIPMCYNIATPNTWKVVFGDKTDEETLREWYNPIYDGVHGGKGWNTDQIILINAYKEYTGPKIILNDRITGYNRLDRVINNQFSDLNILKKLIESGMYTDYHCLRPYNDHKAMNNFIIDCLNPNVKVLEDKVFSFCIYGTERNYYEGLLENIEIIKREFPEFEIYIYKGICDPSWVFDDSLKVIETERSGAINMLYRYLPVTFAGVGFIRDADSRITERDIWCIQEFLKSNKLYHIIRDHFYHKSPIMGGIFGWRQPINFPLDLTSDIGYSHDMSYIEKHLYPLVKNNTLVHSNIYGYVGEHVEVITIPQKDKYDFIGNVIWNGKPKFEYTVGNIVELLNWLRGQDQFKLIQYLSDTIDPSLIPYHQRRNVFDIAYTANYYLRNIEKAQYWLSQFEFAELDGHIYNNANYLFGILSKKIVATFDYKREPAENEIVIVYGNYPDWHHALPYSSKLYRHVSWFFKVQHHVVEYHPCWESVDTIYILNLKERSDRFSDTLTALASVHAPIHRIHHYKAEKNGLPPYVGATKNHVDCIKHFQGSSAKNCLILEDDVVFIDDKEHVWDSISKFFSGSYNYNIAFLSLSRIGERQPLDDLISITKQQCTTSAAYFLTKDTSQTVLDVTNEGLEKMTETGNHHTYCIDRYWCKLPDLLFFKKKLVYQRPSFSNLTQSVNFHLD